MNVERWLPVYGYEGLYEVSNRGRLRSLSRKTPRRNGGFYTVRGGLLAPSVDPIYGYLSTSLSRSGKARSVRIHTLVLEAFVGPKPPDRECCHDDGNPANNYWPENIHWGTREQNMQDTVRHGRSRQKNRTHCRWGHELVKPNIVACYEKVGHRKCLACDRTSTAQRYAFSRGREFDFRTESNRRYARIMGVAA